MFEREDWTAFRSLETLPRKAGVPIGSLPRLVVKELVDNALDATGSCQVGLLLGTGFFVEDQGPGIPGTDQEVAALFSFRRPLMSTKVLRLPTRGALGNGLRVVAGSVVSSHGTLIVSTRGRALRLTPLDDGTTQAELLGKADGTGTRVEVHLGSALPVGQGDLRWGREAILLSKGGPGYAGKTSPHWYDADAFFELLQSAGQRTVRDLIAEFDGCAEPKAGRIAATFKGRLARDLDRVQASALLGTARSYSRPVRPSRLGYVGPIEGLPPHYARSPGALNITPGPGRSATYVPVVIEAWTQLSDRAKVRVFVNRTPVTVELDVFHHKDSLFLTGCGLDHHFKVGRTPPWLVVNIETPFMPITSDGKTPDLLPFSSDIFTLVTKGLKRAKQKTGATDRGLTQKDIILGRLVEAASKASGDGVYRFSLRQLFYAVRPFVLDALGKEPEYDYFAQVITDHEAEHGDIRGMYRDPRGTLYHPHTGEEIALGTLNAERYGRPEWTFNKILYCEKEGFFPILREVRWPERHDCALMTSKGFASRAARDVLDMLGESGEDLYFYCIHDADAYGTTIYQSLQEATRARPCRRVHIVNLGLEPAEALEMDLQVEAVNRKGDKTAPVADYVDAEWREWLQTRRVELNAMTTPQFLEWLDRKFAGQVGKVVPPAEVLKDHLARAVRENLERRITARILRRARIGERVERAMGRREPVLQQRAARIDGDVRRLLGKRPTDPWGEPVRQIARAIARGDAGSLAGSR
jgi:hypothetical protein